MLLAAEVPSEGVGIGAAADDNWVGGARVGMEEKGGEVAG